MALKTSSQYSVFNLEKSEPKSMGMRIFPVSPLKLLLLHPFMVWSVTSSSLTNLTDQSALLAFKSQITFKSDHVILNNWTTNVSFCNWIGVSCSRRRQRVVALNLSYMDLQGTISPHMVNLSFLTILDLRNNSFHGRLTESVGHLRRLRVIYLTHNLLEGIIPPSLSRCRKLQDIRLEYNHLEGRIPKELGDLADLRILDFSGNNIRGIIPSSIFNISTLRVIDLSENRLSGSIPMDMCDNFPRLELLYLGLNLLSGQIPTNLCRCQGLQDIELSENNFTGGIPKDIGCLSKLEYLSVFMNQLTGIVPLSLGNLSQLEHLDFNNNNLWGEIPREFANLPKIKLLSIDFNNLSGPLVLFNSSSLEIISFIDNRLSGHFPEHTGLWLPNLREIYLSNNQLNGNIPSSISNASKLTILELSNNSFSGSVPMTLGKLQFLETLNLGYNQLTNQPVPTELQFLTALTECRALVNLIIGPNPLNGILPDSIGNLSSSLLLFREDESQIKGSIPTTIGNLSNLGILNLPDNALIGNIPSTMGALDRLQRLRLNGNKIQGSIPNEICQPPLLGELSLHENKLSGPIPNCIGNISGLQTLFLSTNALTSIPSSLWSLNNIWILDLSLNSLHGYLPPEIGGLTIVKTLDLSKNQLIDNIPSTISNLKMLKELDLSNNSFQGNIPESFGDLASLEAMDLSFNELSGTIPKSLEKLLDLKLFNLSFNRLEGEVPNGGAFANFTSQSLLGNYELCGVPRLRLQACSIGSRKKSRKRKLLLLYVLVPTSLVIVLVVVLFLIVKYRVKRRQIAPPDNLLAGVQHRMISYHELLHATDNFNETNLLGVGSFGSVYKGLMSDGIIAAVKVLDLQVEGALKSFDAECEVLRNARHRNLVKIISSCSNLEFRALVLEYMPNGSLEKWLYSHNYCLDLLQRINIMIDVGLAVEYLHHGYSEPVVHCDLKPSNVLLDDDMVAHVGDFGIAKVLAKYKSTIRTTTLGTFGYIAPEFGSEGRVTTKGDVYSYGIMLMEMFTRKKPTNEQFVGGSSLRQWVNSSFPDSIIHVIDKNLLTRYQDGTERITELSQHCLSSIMELALMCSKEIREERLNMKDVVVKLAKIKQQLLHDNNTEANTSYSTAREEA